MTTISNSSTTDVTTQEPKPSRTETESHEPSQIPEVIAKLDKQERAYWQHAVDPYEKAIQTFIQAKLADENLSAAASYFFLSQAVFKRPGFAKDLSIAEWIDRICYSPVLINDRFTTAQHDQEQRIKMEWHDQNHPKIKKRVLSGIKSHLREINLFEEIYDQRGIGWGDLTTHLKLKPKLSAWYLMQIEPNSDRIVIDEVIQAWYNAYILAAQDYHNLIRSVPENPEKYILLETQIRKAQRVQFPGLSSVEAERVIHLEGMAHGKEQAGETIITSLYVGRGKKDSDQSRRKRRTEPKGN